MALQTSRDMKSLNRYGHEHHRMYSAHVHLFFTGSLAKRLADALKGSSATGKST